MAPSIPTTLPQNPPTKTARGASPSAPSPFPTPARCPARSPPPKALSPRARSEQHHPYYPPPLAQTVMNSQASCTGGPFLLPHHHQQQHPSLRLGAVKTAQDEGWRLWVVLFPDADGCGGLEWGWGGVAVGWGWGLGWEGLLFVVFGRVGAGLGGGGKMWLRGFLTEKGEEG